MRFAALSAPLLLLALGGCVARTAFDVATAPFRVAGKAYDLATTSQSEADERRGREIRRREERAGRLQRDLDDLEHDCLSGDDGDCRRAAEVRRELAALLPTVPLEPDR
ncbi:hypothetical protein [Aurantiacibacter spongiae]|uniref:Uncharacterized protein n=1 Tax=Aurantiacibacter spongiae TaxID=2488860 RepID=A0A3N5CV91_9SPHN|nr:hypothetical protein [Aurantiacibacter spongiae]RPF71380.1 hypothetical protein EG799_06965 [Aurantiacibacter spongiae]